METYDGGATARNSRRPTQTHDKRRKQHWLDKKMMTLRQLEPDGRFDNKKHDSCPPGCAVCDEKSTQIRDLKIVEQGGVFSLPGVRWEKDKKAEANFKEREANFKERVDLMAKLAAAKKKKEAKLAAAKKKKEAKLAAKKEKKEAKLAIKEKTEAKLAISKKTELKVRLELDLHVDDRDQDLLEPNLTWEDKVVKILHMARCRELTEYNKKLGRSVPTRFCGFNIAFFDLDKESEGVPWKPIHKIPSPPYCWLADSVNVIAIKVAESDRDYPISVFGTVLARDQYDYRCVYLFKRGRDDPQVITSKDDALTLMGPYRALAVSDSMYFEFHLKIKGQGDADEDLSKGYLEHSAIRHVKQPMTRVLYSCLSTVELVYTPVPSAMEASFAVSILKGPSNSIGKVTAWTTGNEENKILLYSKKVADVGGSGPVHGLVAVPVDEELVLHVCIFEGCEHEQDKSFQVVIGPEIDDCFVGLEPYELRVKISWRGVMNRRGPSSHGRPNMWWRLGTDDLLLM